MEITIGFIGIILTVFIIKKTFYSKPNEEFEHLIVLFKSAQKLSLEVQKELEELITKNNAWDNEIFPGIKYGSYLEEMKLSFKKNLSNDLFAKLKELSLTKSNIASMTKSLENQFEALSQMQSQIRIILRQ